ncbi:Gfo/Idh/MocA family protein [Prosthecomicrobium sp. N25]|uniref:Gfo/Idh/MocA family protein n=1 Tax=Prosthecomicrobium sp. N25 TaxID=3129254 RepID=UPI003077C0FE
MIRVALIGLGKMGISHLAIVRSHPSVELVAVCDTAGYLLDVLSKYTGLKTYTDYKTLLASEALDAVVISTPSRYHGEIVRAALERGLHVFCEKPFCLDLDEARSLVDLARAQGVVNQVGYHYRFVGAFQEAHRLLQAGAIGSVHHVRAEAYGPVVLQPKGATWRANKREGGGCLYDYASHAIDLMNYLVGPPRAVSGSVLNRIYSADVDDEVYATFDYGQGMRGQLAANWSDESFRKMSMKITVWGTDGRITADRQEIQVFYRGSNGAALGLNSGWNVRYTTDLTSEVSYYLRGEEYSAQMDHFFSSIENRSIENVSPFSSALLTDTVIHQIQRDALGERAEPAAARPARGGLVKRVFRFS